MRRYWITTHWPLYERENDTHHRNVYLQEGTQDAGRDLGKGDKVLIYESLTGKTRLEILVDGKSRPIPWQRGRGGIVTAADVVSEFTRVDPAEALQTYTDGSRMNWGWKARTANHVSSGYVPLSEVNRVLGYKSGSVLRGFGDLNSGLKQIDKATYDELLRLFRGNSQTVAPAPGGQVPPPGHWREGVGEGPDHLALKEYVATFPSVVLNERGVETVKVEYPFPSGDQADIILKDQAGRFIGVEIEISQSDRQLEGLLQAVKYRHMVAITEGVTFEECRSVLIAYHLGSVIKALCAKYDVQAIEIERRAVSDWRKLSRAKRI